MNNHADFEHRLTTALATYADRAPVEVDAVTLTSVVAHGRAHRRWPLIRRAEVDRRPDLRVALLLLVLGLAVAVGVGLIVVGALPSQPRPLAVMTVGRVNHTATPLPDGRILIAGGFTTANASLASVASAELYDPRSRTFTPTGSMTTARGDHTATRLSDGRVLVIGGFETGPGEVPLASAEIFDPKSGTFSPTGSMTTARGGYTATLLTDGRVLVAGGKSDPAELASAELYDPRTGTFSPTGSMATAREGHAATLLADGRVLVTGGQGEKEGLASAELYDPTSGTFSQTGPMGARRATPTATLLADGHVLVAGGIDSFAAAGLALASAELYDPKSGTFSPAGSMTTARVGHAATLLADGRVLVAGGTSSGNQAASAEILASAELYDPKTGTFSPTGSMTTARGDQTATRLSDGRVLVAGGIEVIGLSGPGPALASVEMYDPAVGSFSQGNPSPIPRASAAAVATELPSAGSSLPSLDVATWVDFTSPRNGISARFPPGSVVTAALGDSYYTRQGFAAPRIGHLHDPGPTEGVVDSAISPGGMAFFISSLWIPAGMSEAAWWNEYAGADVCASCIPGRVPGPSAACFPKLPSDYTPITVDGQRGYEHGGLPSCNFTEVVVLVGGRSYQLTAYVNVDGHFAGTVFDQRLFDAWLSTIQFDPASADDAPLASPAAS